MIAHIDTIKKSISDPERGDLVTAILSWNPSAIPEFPCTRLSWFSVMHAAVLDEDFVRSYVAPTPLEGRLALISYLSYWASAGYKIYDGEMMSLQSSGIIKSSDGYDQLRRRLRGAALDAIPLSALLKEVDRREDNGKEAPLELPYKDICGILGVGPKAVKRLRLAEVIPLLTRAERELSASIVCLIDQAGVGLDEASIRKAVKEGKLSPNCCPGYGKLSHQRVLAFLGEDSASQTQQGKPRARKARVDLSKYRRVALLRGNPEVIRILVERVASEIGNDLRWSLREDSLVEVKAFERLFESLGALRGRMPKGLVSEVFKDPLIK